ncbi:MAG: circadian clock KaiB family protein [Desulfohalobiaceae bacterium]
MAKDEDVSQDSGSKHSDQESTVEDQGRKNPRNFFQLRLFVSGSTSRSQQAIQNLRQICEEHLQGRYKLEVIDVAKDPGQVRQRQILAVPTLIKELPLPLRKIVGDLSEKEKVLEGLDIQPKESE